MQIFLRLTVCIRDRNYYFSVEIALHASLLTLAQPALTTIKISTHIIIGIKVNVVHLDDEQRKRNG